jgi:hypothetical protein
VNTWSWRRRPVPRSLDDELPGQDSPLAMAGRACCCPAHPVVTVIMPPAPGRPHPAELLLCGHHYRVHRAALQAAGAAAYDQTGALIMAGGSQQLPMSGHHAMAARR